MTIYPLNHSTIQLLNPSAHLLTLKFEHLEQEIAEMCYSNRPVSSNFISIKGYKNGW